MAESAAPGQQAPGRRDLTYTFWAMAGCTAVALAVTAVATPRSAFAMLWALACLACGFAVGFLFGIPRVLDDGSVRGAPAPSTTDPVALSAEGAGAQRLVVNTNLTEISDWLTKIIVGVGLVELKQLPDYLARAGDYIGRGLTPAYAVCTAPAATRCVEPLAVGIVLLFGTLGFLAGYLLTRLYLSSAFRRADDLLVLSPQARVAFQGTPLERDGQKVSVANLDREAARLQKVTAGDVPLVSDEQAIWARAQFDAGKYDDALAGYQRAIELAPRNAQYRYAYAIALKYTTGTVGLPAVVAELEKARQLADGQADVQLRATIYASLTYNALYLDPPKGYTLAREAALAYVDRPEHLPNADVWFNLACAYGQQYTQDRATAGEAPAHLRDDALEALQKAIAIQPALRPRALAIMKGQSGIDNDLAAMAQDDDRFQALGQGES